MAQEVFARVWQDRDEYKPGTPVLAYLLGFARDMVREHKARRRHEKPTHPRPLTRLADSLPAGQTPLPSRIESAEAVQVIRALVAKLPGRQRQAVELVYFSGMGPREAARRLACSAKTLRGFLSLACRSLRDRCNQSQKK